MTIAWRALRDHRATRTALAVALTAAGAVLWQHTTGERPTVVDIAAALSTLHQILTPGPGHPGPSTTGGRSRPRVP
ncbi:hypothetical protein AB0M43_37460 [Longispora sp. NPDC051575]|uniref:hypothetical protein n=1 Tax=Longispora sp. NPDC051575 TaxID=3154943 RepID=UPI0034269DA6